MTDNRLRAADLVTWVRRAAEGHPRYLFGIAGSPGSGKTTLAAHVASELSAPVVSMDGFHLPNSVLDTRGTRGVKGAPHTFAADAFVSAVGGLRSVVADRRFPSFDRGIDEPTPDRIRVASTDHIVIVEGNYLLLDQPPWLRLRAIFDAIAHVDVDSETRVERLVGRHMQFGRSREEAEAFVRDSDERNSLLIEAVRHRAHLIVTV